jgi:hypothetical protein
MVCQQHGVLTDDQPSLAHVCVLLEHHGMM